MGIGGATSSGNTAIPREKILAAYRAGPEAIVSLIQYLQDSDEGELRALQTQLDAHAQQLKQLQEQLHTDSHNRSRPPSCDGMARRPYPNREKSKRKSGGQPGHEGMTLKRVAVPDRVVGEFPADVKQAVQYGPRVCSSVIYLKDYALLPYRRLRQLMTDLFGVRMSAGTPARVELECAERLRETVDQIRREAGAAAVVHFDGTGLRVKGKLCWLHSASTKRDELLSSASSPRHGGDGCHGCPGRLRRGGGV